MRPRVLVYLGRAANCNVGKCWWNVLNCHIMGIRLPPVACCYSTRLIRRDRRGSQVTATIDTGVSGILAPAGAAGHSGAAFIAVISGAGVLRPGALVYLGKAANCNVGECWWNVLNCHIMGIGLSSIARCYGAGLIRRN